MNFWNKDLLPVLSLTTSNMLSITRAKIKDNSEIVEANSRRIRELQENNLTLIVESKKAHEVETRILDIIEFLKEPKPKR